MVLTELDQKGEKTALTIRTDPDLKHFYTSLPDRLRTKILERAIRTYMKEQHST
jgi:predicted transcriptional regulator